MLQWKHRTPAEAERQRGGGGQGPGKERQATQRKTDIGGEVISGERDTGPAPRRNEQTGTVLMRGRRDRACSD